MVSLETFMDELADAGILAEGYYLSDIALAGMPCGLASVGCVDDESDTHLLAGGSSTFEEYERTSSYFKDNNQIATYHQGKVYALGYSPSEPGKMYLRATAVEMDHVWDGGTVTKEPACEEEGVRTFTCSQCGMTKTEPIAPTGNHVWDGGKVTRQATATTDGEKLFTCTACGKTRTEVIPATGTNPDKQSTTGGGTQTKSTSTTSASTTRKTLPKTADPCASWPVAPLLLAAAATLVVAAGLREKGKAAR
ncbi:MAG: hypothetical protein IKG11_03775 [Atopobiaceae bacterium]|nr:hypothetical protein [Atopobiaceae bacterium]